MIYGSGLFNPFQPTKSKVFVSYHHGGDQPYYDAFSRTFSDTYDIVYDNSLARQIDSDSPEYVMRRIREEHITGTSCTVVLVGAATYQRKYVDWEIYATLEKELLGRIRFDSFSHAKRELDHYFEGYNFARTHMGIGGVTPADRYFGRVQRGLAMIEANISALDRDGAEQRLPGERAVVLQLAMVNGRLEFWFAGKRVELS